MFETFRPQLASLRLHPGTIGAALALTLVACVTINVYFPEAAVKDLSERIEEAVAREAAKDGDTPTDGAATDGAATDGATTDGAATDGAASPSSVGGAALLAQRAYRAFAKTALRLTAEPVMADQVAAPEVTNPAIRRIIASRAARLPALNRFKSQGALGENNRALVEVRDLSVLELQQRAQAQRVARAENDDRNRMFREIAAATGADLSTLPQIQQTYARTLRENARRGDWIQMPDGQWRQK